PRATTDTSCPLAASRAAMCPPTAPAPNMQIFMEALPATAHVQLPDLDHAAVLEDKARPQPIPVVRVVQPRFRAFCRLALLWSFPHDGLHLVLRLSDANVCDVDGVDERGPAFRVRSHVAGGTRIVRATE